MDKKFESFKKLLERVYENNKIYREKMDKLGITPLDIKSEDDIRKLSITEKNISLSIILMVITSHPKKIS